MAFRGRMVFSGFATTQPLSRTRIPQALQLLEDTMIRPDTTAGWRLHSSDRVAENNLQTQSPGLYRRSDGELAAPDLLSARRAIINAP
jgi:hypothetical protein